MNFWLDFLPVKVGNNTIRCKLLSFKNINNLEKGSQFWDSFFYSIPTLNFK